jgi:hypothetical protein
MAEINPINLRQTPSSINKDYKYDNGTYNQEIYNKIGGID